MIHSAADKRFHQLMLHFSQEQDLVRRAELEQSIWHAYGSECAVCVIDMSGFTRITERFGIVHYLSMITRMQLTAAPLIKEHGGTLVKFEADNCYATFSDTLEAIRGCIALQIALDTGNRLTDENHEIRIACGIDYGKILMPHAADFFGDCVNHASKLGEDLAEAGDILVGATAMQRVPPESGIVTAATTFHLSGVQIEACAVSYS